MGEIPVCSLKKRILQKKNLKLIFLIFLILIIPSIQLYSLPIKVYGSLGAGSGIIESSISGFYLKSMPIISSGITVTIRNSRITRLGFDLNLLYSFKSNYNDYFYYGPFFEIGLSPLLEIYIFRFLELGFFGTVTPTYTGYENSVDLKIGGYLLVPIKSRWLKSILLQYEHGFLNGYKLNERIVLKTRILIYKKD